jgi:hypothetical protein
MTEILRSAQNDGDAVILSEAKDPLPSAPLASAEFPWGFILKVFY